MKAPTMSDDEVNEIERAKVEAMTDAEYQAFTHSLRAVAYHGAWRPPKPKD